MSIRLHWQNCGYHTETNWSRFGGKVTRVLKHPGRLCGQSWYLDLLFKLEFKAKKLLLQMRTFWSHGLSTVVKDSRKTHENVHKLDGFNSKQYQRGRNRCSACQVADFGRSQDGGQGTEQMRTYLDISGPKDSLMTLETLFCLTDISSTMFL